MVIITTLKQKDLSAVSAEQLLLTPKNNLKKIERFTMFYIESDHPKQDLLHAITSSYLFANPNKHHLITDSSLHHLPQQCLYFNITRKTPRSLHYKSKKLDSLLNTTSSNTNVIESDLWGFSYSKDTDITQLDTSNIIQTTIQSTPNNMGLFAHPLIHNITPLTYEQLANTLTSSTPCYSTP
jgi:hypothetical protein